MDDMIIYLWHRLTKVFSQMPFCRLIFVPSLNLPHLNISLISLNIFKYLLNVIEEVKRTGDPNL